MSNKKNEVPTDHDEFMKWMMETSKPEYVRPKSSDSDTRDGKSSDKPFPNSINDFDISSINMNIIGLKDEDSSPTKTTDATVANEDNSITDIGISSIKKRVLGQMSKMDETWAADTDTAITADADIINIVTEDNEVEDTVGEVATKMK